ncbi:hypothetical protein S40285_08601 [Stachybotrys chlorohalonatus IBT 40285]|uniref:Cation/H+ exchanger transmembrane domain-containing protein n=1 Tax=Stachybotrys chlorohalonatus (strain IBT 40285) TaxID=1283841 RepID=A0A084QQK9_STAC4|nr:hypothetical protein S40285_08601 [Stachybotrys chlorohalonata IBT 40285]
MLSPVISFVVGAVAGPATGLLQFEAWSGGAVHLETHTLNFTRLSLCVQVLISGVQLPKRFLARSWTSMLVMLLPGMILMWLMSALLIWGICELADDTGADGGGRRIPFLHALAIGSCLAPTDPVLASTIIKGRWADQHVPAPLAQIISGESGANDGLGYPFLFLALYLIAYVGGGSQGPALEGGPSGAMSLLFGNTIAYVVVLGVIWGAVVGYASAKLLRLCRNLHYVDHESFFAFPILFAIFLIGTCGMAGSDDILAAFVAGNALSWDDWFRRKTSEDSFASTFELFLNLALFIYLGATCPWDVFHTTSSHLSQWHIPLWRLACVAIAILVLRRLPMLLLFYKTGLLRRHVKTIGQATFMGFFGPMGISSIFYLQELLRFSREKLLDQDGHMNPAGQELFATARQVVWFVVTSSIVVHGLAIPFWQAVAKIWMHIYPSKTRSDYAHSGVREFVEKERHAIRHALKVSSQEETDTEQQYETPIWQHARPKPVFRHLKA